MSHRPHFYVRRLVAADPGESPNAYVPMITVEIRAFWPDLEKPKVAAILTDAYVEAMGELGADLPYQDFEEARHLGWPG